MVRVAMTEDWSSPVGGFAEVADRTAALAWIEAEARARRCRVAGYTRVIIDPETRRNIVDFGDYSMFGLIQFDTKAEAAEALLPEPPKTGEEADRGAR